MTIGGGHAGGQLGWIHFGLGDADGAEIRVEWPDGETGPWLELARQPVRHDRARRGRSRGSGLHPAADRRGRRDGQRAARRGRPPRLRHARRDARDPGRDRTGTGWSGSGPACDEHGYDRSSCTPTASTAPTSPTSPASTRASRRPCSSSAPPGEPAILVGNECYGMAGAAPLADAAASVPGPQPARPASGPLPAADRDPGRRGHRGRQPGRGHRLEGVRRPRDDRGAGVHRRRAASDDARRVSWRTPPTC